MTTNIRKTDDEIDEEATNDETAKLMNDVRKLALRRGAPAAVIIFCEANGETSRAVWGATDDDMERTSVWIDAFLADTALINPVMKD